jgi:putative MATE family efflux protein
MEKTISNNANSLANGKVGKLLWKYALPCVIALLITALYNVVDQIFIGNSAIGSIGNTATTVVFPITILALALSLLIGDGASAFLSLCQGKKDTKMASLAIGGSITLALLISGVFSLVFLLAMDPILLTCLGATENVLPYAHSYGMIIVAGIVFSVYTNVMNPIIRSDGSPIYAMLAQGIGAVINIILDPTFMYAFNMGIEGAAYATIIGQAVSTIMSLAYLAKAKTFSFSWSSLIKGMKYLGKTLRLGISSFFIQMSLVAVTITSNVLLGIYGPKAGLGADDPIAVFGITYKVFTIVINIPIGIALGALPIIGYNYGASNYSRCKKTYNLVIVSTLIVTAIATIIFEVAPQAVISLFGNASENYVNFGILCFRIYLSCIILTGLQRTSSIFFQALGKPIQATILSLVRDLALLVPLSICLPLGMGIDGFLWSAPIADVIAFVLTAIMVIYEYNTLSKQEKKVTTPSNVTIVPSTQGVIITIAREHGTSGRAIGMELAKQLRIPFYDKEVTSLVANKTGLNAEYISSVEEGEVSSINDLYSTLDPTSSAKLAQISILEEIAKNGAAVIVGRAADAILEGKVTLCKIFVYAPLDYRIKNVMNEYGDNLELAQKNIEKSDAHRAKYYEEMAGHKWNEMDNYDLCLNSSNGVEESVSTILRYLEANKK